MTQKSATKTDQDRNAYAEEINRQISTQSAILAGFAFTGLTANTYNSHRGYLEAAFAIGAVCTISLEVVALFLSGILIFVSKSHHIGAH